MERQEALSYFPTTGLINRIYDDFENRTCESCKYKYVVDSMTTECRHNESPIDYLDLDCFDDFCCNKYENKLNEKNLERLR